MVVAAQVEHLDGGERRAGVHQAGHQHVAVVVAVIVVAVAAIPAVTISPVAVAAIVAAAVVEIVVIGGVQHVLVVLVLGVGARGGLNLLIRHDEEPDVVIADFFQRLEPDQLLQVVGDVRGVAEVGAVDVALVLLRVAGVGEVGERGLARVGKDAARGAQDGREVLQGPPVIRHLEGQAQRGAVDDDPVGIAVGRQGFAHAGAQAFRGQDGLQAAAALDGNLLDGGTDTAGRLVRGDVVGVLRQAGGLLDVFVGVEELGLPVDEEEGCILAHAVVDGAELQLGGFVAVDVVDAGVVDREAGNVEQVDAAAFTHRRVHLDVDAGELGGKVLHRIQVGLEDAQVLLAELLAEIEGERILAVVHRDALGDALAPVPDRAVGAVLLGVVDGLFELIDVHVLQDVLLALGEAGNGVARGGEMERLEDGIGAEVEGVLDRDEGEGGAARRQAEFGVAERSDGDPLLGQAGEVVGHRQDDVFDGKGDGVDVVLLVGGDQVLPQLGVDFEAGGAQDGRKKGRNDITLHHGLQTGRKNDCTGQYSFRRKGPLRRRAGPGAPMPLRVRPAVLPRLPNPG